MGSAESFRIRRLGHRVVKKRRTPVFFDGAGFNLKSASDPKYPTYAYTNERAFINRNNGSTPPCSPGADRICCVLTRDLLGVTILFMDHRDRANLFVPPRLHPQKRVDPGRLPPGKEEARAALGPALRVEGERGCWRASEGWVTREAVWEAFVGPVAPGMRLFARCQCLRPEHAEHIRHPPEGPIRREPHFLGTYWSLWEIEHKIAGMEERGEGCLVRGNGGVPLVVPAKYQVSYGPKRISIKHAAWALSNPNKPLPPLHALIRTCGTRGCANPAHIVYNPLLAEPRPPKPPRRKRGRKVKMTPEEIEKAAEMRRSGLLLRQIAEHFKVSPETVRKYTLTAAQEGDTV